MNSKQKGKRGEREAAKELQKVFGCTARRGVQYAGHPDAPDVVTDIPGLHFEVKRNEALNVGKAVEQSQRDKRESDIGVVLHRKNGKPWLITMLLEDAPKFSKIIMERDQDGTKDDNI